MYFGEETFRKVTTWKTMHKWDDNIKICLKETGSEDVGSISLAQDRDRWWAVVNMVVSLQV
jgi:hypothetical protein